MGGGSCLLYISLAYYMQKGGGWVQIACKIAYILNGRPPAGNSKGKITICYIKPFLVQLFISDIGRFTTFNE